LKTTPKKPQQFDPPPAGAHIEERSVGLGLGLLVGALLGLLIGAITLLTFQLQRRDAVEEVKNVPAESNQPPINIVQPPIEIPRPEVLPTNNTTPAPTTENDPTIPVVVSSSPKDGATAVPIDAQIVLTFNVDMDPATITSETISVFNTTANQNITADFRLTYRQDAKQLTIAFADANDALSPGFEYGVLASTGVKSISGVSLEEPFRLTFTTK
jgi:hypothetical protein